jgi:hypothetical protein
MVISSLSVVMSIPAPCTKLLKVRSLPESPPYTVAPAPRFIADAEPLPPVADIVITFPDVVTVTFPAPVMDLNMRFSRLEPDIPAYT